MILDYKNILGQGNKSLYKLTNMKQYALFVASSIEEYFSTFIHLINKNMLQKKNDGKITKFFNL